MRLTRAGRSAWPRRREIASILLFKYPPLTPTALDLTRGERIFLVGIRVLAALEFDAERRALEAQRRMKAVDEIALVGGGHGLRLRAVHYDERRIAAALMGVTQLDAAAVRDGLRVVYHRVLLQPREFGRRHLAHRGLVRAHRGAGRGARAAAGQ